MVPVSIFYLSRVIGKKVYFEDGKFVGVLKDLIIDTNFLMPKVTAVKLKIGSSSKIFDFNNFSILEENNAYFIKCNNLVEIKELHGANMLLVKNILDKQIVDINGKKLVRVNDLRLATLSNDIFVVAVDVGMEGLLRRLEMAKLTQKILKLFGKTMPSKLILWDEVETIGYSNTDIKLSKSSSKLSTLHASDLADIIEELDRKTQAAVFASLDDEQAADVLEELETDAQISIIESMTVEKAADVLEKMPSDEVADILDEMEDDAAEELLSEMEDDAAEEVRELMEYADNKVGSLMATDFISFDENMTVASTIDELRRLKPESDSIYYLYVLDTNEKLIATVSLRDLIVSSPDVTLSSIMDMDIKYVYDDGKIDTLADIISKYSLLSLPVVDHEMKMVGIVVIDDVVYELLKRRKRKI